MGSVAIPSFEDFLASQKKTQGIPSFEEFKAGVSPKPTTPGLREHGNLSLSNRPQIKNPDGSVSTVRSESYGIGNDEVLLPTVSKAGKNVSAVDEYRRTGEHLGKFDTPANADAYAQQIHEYQEGGLPIYPNPPAPPVTARKPGRNEMGDAGTRRYNAEAPVNFSESAQGPVEKLGVLPLQGAVDLAGGAKKVATNTLGTNPNPRQLARGASEMAGGIGEILTPTAIANPASWPGIAVGTGVGAATEGAAKLAGVPDEYAELGGILTGVVSGAGTNRAVKRGINWARNKMDEGDWKKLMYEGVKPQAQNLDFGKQLDRSMPQIVKAAGNKPITGLDDLIDATKAAKANAWAEYESINPNARLQGDVISGDPIADAMIRSIPERTRLENPGIVQAVTQRAMAYKGKRFTLSQAEQLLQQTNADLQTYYAKEYPRERNTRLIKDANVAPDVAAGDAWRAQIYGYLDSPNEGAAAQAAKQKYGSLLDLEGELFRRKNVMERQAPESLSQQIGKVRAVGKGAAGVLNIGMGAARGDIGQMASGSAKIGEAVGGVKASDWLHERNMTNDLIRRAFVNYKPTPAPTAWAGPDRMLDKPVRKMPGAGLQNDKSGPIEPTLPQTGQLNPGAAEDYLPKSPISRQLPSPTHKMPAAPDQSGPTPQPFDLRWQPAPWSARNRQLPAGPSQMPSDASSQLGDILDTVPVKDASGKTTFIPSAQRNTTPKSSNPKIVQPAGPKEFPYNRLAAYAKAEGRTVDQVIEQLTAEGYKITGRLPTTPAKPRRNW